MATTIVPPYQLGEDEENKEIVSRYRKLLRTAKPFIKDKSDTALIRKAFLVATKAHSGTRRKSGEPYIFHPIAVAQICAEEIGLGPTAIAAALLHDVVEDTEWEIKDIEREFGHKIARIIDGLTKISGISQHQTSQQAENFRKILLTLSEDVRVILIKIADRLHNMRTLSSMSRSGQLKIASETIYLYAPLAHRLGLYTIKSELEDLYLKYTEPKTYQEISEKLQSTKSNRERFIREFIAPIDKELQKYGLKYVIKGRPKSIYSIYNKIKKRNIPFEEIYDLFAIRIILDVPLEQEKSACWQVYSIVTDYYKPNPERLKDWISTPRSNGYESLHTTVMSKLGQWVEVQIRTNRMNEIAEKGYAAHWKYKENTNRESELDKWLLQVREVLEQTDAATGIEFVNDFRPALFSEELYVFTPKGDLRILPAGATALDFAFDIHTQVGAKCIGAKVNHKLVPISYRLQSGDQVEILTSSKQKPNEGWLRIAATSKAIAKIKEHLREEKKQVAAFGKEILERKFKKYKIQVTDETINQLRAFFDEKTPQDVLYKIGTSSISSDDLKRFYEVRESKNKKTTQILDAKSFEQEVKKIRGKKDSDLLLIGEDMEKIDYTLSPCCHPIAGDDVFGFVTVNEGIKIHRTTCPNAIELLSNYGYRVVKAKWSFQKELMFLSGVQVNGTDRIGLVKDITDIISNELKVNMKSINIETEDGLFQGKIMLYVNNVEHLETLMQKMKQLNGIVSVSRFD